MKERQTKTGRQAERTMKEFKELRKLSRSISKPAKNKTPQDKPQIVVVPKTVIPINNSKKISGSTGQSGLRRRQKVAVQLIQHHGSEENPSETVGFRLMFAKLLHKLCEREPTLTLKTLQNFGIMLVFIVVVFVGSVLIIFHDKGEQVLAFIGEDHQHSEPSRVVVSTEKKAKP